MPFVMNRGQRIHYTEAGAGPTVVFQHGLLSNAASWQECGYCDALSDAYRVVCIDSLGHGESDKPADPALYARDARVGDVLAVADELGAERIHLIGYSMGGWIASGFALRAPERLASLVVAGWDVADGAQTAAASLGGNLSFEGLLAGAEALAPELVAWVTDDVRPGLEACWDHLADLAGAAGAVAKLEAPVLFWNGAQDPYHDPMERWAAAHGFDFLSVPGDHVSAVFEHAKPSIKGLRAFLERAAGRGVPRPAPSPGGAT
jgi:pimeloyl-ACP methyl ester carboxylesterase